MLLLHISIKTVIKICLLVCIAKGFIDLIYCLETMEEIESLSLQLLLFKFLNRLWFKISICTLRHLLISVQRMLYCLHLAANPVMIWTNWTWILLFSLLFRWLVLLFNWLQDFNDSFYSLVVFFSFCYFNLRHFVETYTEISWCLMPMTQSASIIMILYNTQTCITQNLFDTLILFSIHPKWGSVSSIDTCIICVTVIDIDVILYILIIIISKPDSFHIWNVSLSQIMLYTPSTLKLIPRLFSFNIQPHCWLWFSSFSCICCLS